MRYCLHSPLDSTSQTVVDHLALLLGTQDYLHSKGCLRLFANYPDYYCLRHGNNKWTPVLDVLAAEREVIAVDLPGFGDTPPLPGEVSIATLADAVTAYLRAHDLMGVDVAGNSMGARLVLELARRDVVGAVVSLDPGGFWRGWERAFFATSIALSIRLIRLL